MNKQSDKERERERDRTGNQLPWHVESTTFQAKEVEVRPLISFTIFNVQNLVVFVVSVVGAAPSAAAAAEAATACGGLTLEFHCASFFAFPWDAWRLACDTPREKKNGENQKP